MSDVSFGEMRIEFTAGAPRSVVMTVRATVTTKAELDKLIAAVGTSRDLLRDSGSDPEGEKPSGFECVASQSGGSGASASPEPSPPSPPPSSPKGVNP